MTQEKMQMETDAFCKALSEHLLQRMDLTCEQGPVEVLTEYVQMLHEENGIASVFQGFSGIYDFASAGGAMDAYRRNHATYLRFAMEYLHDAVKVVQEIDCLVAVLSQKADELKNHIFDANSTFPCCFPLEYKKIKDAILEGE